MDPIIRRIPAAKYIGVSVPTLDRWLALGKIPKPTKFSARASGWKQSVLDEFIAKHTQ